MIFSKEEKELLLGIIFKEQTKMISEMDAYDNEKYKKLEALKVKIRDM